MDTIGLDLHKHETQLFMGRDDGSFEEQRIVTSRERLTAVLGSRSLTGWRENSCHCSSGWRRSTSRLRADCGRRLAPDYARGD